MIEMIENMAVVIFHKESALILNANLKKNLVQGPFQTPSNNGHTVVSFSPNGRIRRLALHCSEPTFLD